MDVLSAKFSCNKCCPSVRSVCSSAILECPYISCANDKGYHFCVHPDILTAYMGSNPLLLRYAHLGKVKQPTFGAPFLAPSSGHGGEQRDS